MLKRTAGMAYGQKCVSFCWVDLCLGALMLAKYSPLSFQQQPNIVPIELIQKHQKNTSPWFEGPPHAALMTHWANNLDTSSLQILQTNMTGQRIKEWIRKFGWTTMPCWFLKVSNAEHLAKHDHAQKTMRYHETLSASISSRCWTAVTVQASTLRIASISDTAAKAAPKRRNSLQSRRIQLCRCAI